MIKEWRGGLHFLTGFEYSDRGGGMNFILSNGQRTEQRDTWIDDYQDYMLPADSHERIRSVLIHHLSYHISGFSFFDKEGACLWKIGDTWPSFYV